MNVKCFKSRLQVAFDRNYSFGTSGSNGTTREHLWTKPERPTDLWLSAISIDPHLKYFTEKKNGRAKTID